MGEAQLRSLVALFACQVHWGNCDPAGIIFYPTYYQWFDAASWAMFDRVGYSAKRMRAEHRAMPLVATECQFKHPAEQGNHCEVRSRIARWGGKSFVVAHDVVRSDGVLLATGSETRVWGRFENGPGSALKAEEIPASLKALFEAP